MIQKTNRVTRTVITAITGISVKGQRPVHVRIESLESLLGAAAPNLRARIKLGITHKAANSIAKFALMFVRTRTGTIATAIKRNSIQRLSCNNRIPMRSF